MDYEKKYKEALARARKLYEQGTITESLCYVFPELKESEDERIRKALIKFHKSTIDIDGIKGGDILAWLEKQGEQKPAWSEEDKRNIQMVDSVLFYDKNLPEDTCIRLRNWLKSLKPQSHWKPSEEQMRVLDLAIRCGVNRGTTEVTTLISLFNDLKKLKE